MKVIINVSHRFIKDVKRLCKRYPSFRNDIVKVQEALKENPSLGIDLGNGFRKIRMAITSKGKGKSGGGRVITFFVRQVEETVHVLLTTVYDKADCENITIKELVEIIKQEMTK